MVKEGSRDDATDRTGTIRYLRDSEGRHWTVRQMNHPGYDRRSSSSLLFERHDVIRRVRNFPENWLALTDAELLVISNSR